MSRRRCLPPGSRHTPMKVCASSMSVRPLMGSCSSSASRDWTREGDEEGTEEDPPRAEELLELEEERLEKCYHQRGGGKEAEERVPLKVRRHSLPRRRGGGHRTVVEQDSHRWIGQLVGDEAGATKL